MIGAEDIRGTPFPQNITDNIQTAEENKRCQRPLLKPPEMITDTAVDKPKSEDSPESLKEKACGKTENFAESRRRHPETNVIRKCSCHTFFRNPDRPGLVHQNMKDLISVVMIRVLPCQPADPGEINPEGKDKNNENCSANHITIPLRHPERTLAANRAAAAPDHSQSQRYGQINLHPAKHQNQNRQ